METYAALEDPIKEILLKSRKAIRKEKHQYIYLKNF